MTTLALNSWPTALYPSDITNAYGWQSSDVVTGTGETIALVDAHDDPTIASNLDTFSTQFGLPACTTANGCFQKVNQTGGATTYPSKTAGWDTEISLDVEYAHAMAPKAHILLVEANTTSFTSLFTAVSYAAAHAQYVSMSWGGTEFAGETSHDATFTAHAGIVSYFAATGDTAKQVSYPASSPDVVSVGGTKLTVALEGASKSVTRFTVAKRKAGDTWEAESGWVTGGGGCSAYELAAAAQKDFSKYDQAGVTCNGYRGTPDVAGDASPTTGVAVYDTIPTKLTKSTRATYEGWFQIGGTSLATPLWAAHSAADAVHVTETYVYGSYIPFYNITTGGNGRDCVLGYNLCDGRGSWSTSHGKLSTAAPSLGGFPASGTGTGYVTVATVGRPTNFFFTSRTTHSTTDSVPPGATVKVIWTAGTAGAHFKVYDLASGTILCTAPAGTDSCTFDVPSTPTGSQELSLRAALGSSAGWNAGLYATATNSITLVVT